jgi:hypothetical protein
MKISILYYLKIVNLNLCSSHDPIINISCPDLVPAKFLTQRAQSRRKVGRKKIMYNLSMLCAISAVSVFKNNMFNKDERDPEHNSQSCKQMKNSFVSSRRDLPAHRIGLYTKEDSCGMTRENSSFVCPKDSLGAAAGCTINRPG